jgi:hypothetical protein
MITILTYDHPHRKTQDLLLRLAMRDDQQEIVVLATPWIERKGFVPLVSHRAFAPLNVDLLRFCSKLGARLVRVDSASIGHALDDLAPEIVLIGGAGILPRDVVNSHTVVNAHPGYLPYERGLDTLKWAIYEGHPIGVTTHLAVEEADSGPLIRQQLVPLEPWDTFHSVALRQYDIEIRMLAEAVDDIVDAPLTLPGTEYPIHRRMPHRLEKLLFERLSAILPEGNVDEKIQR